MWCGFVGGTSFIYFGLKYIDVLGLWIEIDSLKKNNNNQNQNQNQKRKERKRVLGFSLS